MSIPGCRAPSPKPERPGNDDAVANAEWSLVAGWITQISRPCLGEMAAVTATEACQPTSAGYVTSVTGPNFAPYPA